MEEFEFLHSLLSKLDPKFTALPSGPGDDCAIFSSKGKILVSHDLLVEGVHFNLNWSNLKDVAWKALATNESDIASMGGVPIGYTIGLVVPDGYKAIVEELYEGFNEYLMEREASGFFQKILGGDITSGSSFSISVSVIGEASQAILRSGSKPGDLLAVSGPIGLAGIGLSLLSESCTLSPTKELEHISLLKHRRPIPQTSLGVFLSSKGLATSMIDISDGLLQEAKHLATASQLTAVVELSCFSYPAQIGTQMELLELLSSGDDYELLFTLRDVAAFEVVKDSYPNSFIVGKMIVRGEDTLSIENKGESLKNIDSLGRKLTNLGYRHSF